MYEYVFMCVCVFVCVCDSVFMCVCVTNGGVVSGYCKRGL